MYITSPPQLLQWRTWRSCRAARDAGGLAVCDEISAPRDLRAVNVSIDPHYVKGGAPLVLSQLLTELCGEMFVSHENRSDRQRA